jgi:hypothetical protein
VGARVVDVSSGTWIALASVVAAVATLAAGYTVGICSRRGIGERRSWMRVRASQARAVAFAGLGIATALALAGVVDSNRAADAKFQRAIYANCAGNNVLRGKLRDLLTASFSRPTSRPLSPAERAARAAFLRDSLESLRDVPCNKIVPTP